MSDDARIPELEARMAAIEDVVREQVAIAVERRPKMDDAMAQVHDIRDAVVALNRTLRTALWLFSVPTITGVAGVLALVWGGM